MSEGNHDRDNVYTLYDAQGNPEHYVRLDDHKNEREQLNEAILIIRECLDMSANHPATTRRMKAFLNRRYEAGRD